MMRRIIITNKGLIEMEDLHYIGNSPKRGDATKIGMFGSGWKYALAWLIRNDCKPKIYSGTKEITIETESIVTSKNVFDAIVINGHRTSLTMQMGPEWKGWMALREIFSNAIDEGNETIKIDYVDPVPMPDVTTVIIPANGELMDVIDHFEEYFSFHKKADYENKHGRVFIKKTNSTINVFRKGIRCYEDGSNTMLDFDFNKININESRLARTYHVDDAARELLNICEEPIILRKSIESDYKDILPINITTHYKICIRAMVNEGITFQTDSFIINDPSSIKIPKGWYWKLVDEGILPNPISELFKTLKHNFFSVTGYEIEEAEIAHYISSFVKNPIVKVGIIESGYNDVNYYAEGDKFLISEKYMKSDRRLPFKDLAAELLIEQREIIKNYMMNKM